jgi:putative transposase
MLMGIKFKAYPTKEQKNILSQWMGCARFIWNAKCEEEHYLVSFAKRYLPLDSFPPIDQTYSQYKTELSPWLFACPSQILRNSASNWFKTHKNYQKKLCGKPRRKKKSNGGSIHLTRELFKLEQCGSVTRLFIGTKTNPLGYLSIKIHRSYKTPNSLTIKKKNGVYSVSFCYEDALDENTLMTEQDHLEHLEGCSLPELEEMTIGIDRGIKRPVQAGDFVFDFTEEQKKKKKGKEKYLKRCQKRLAFQKKGSKRRGRTKQKIAKAQSKIANIRKDFCHKTSRAIIQQENVKVIVLESLQTKNMTKKPKPKRDEKTKKWLKNGSKAKAALNLAILDKGWYQFESFLKYKSYRAGKALFKISPQHTSQECAVCGHTHPNNRKTQEKFHCESCGHFDHADHNAAEVIKKRAIHLIHSGTELSSQGILLDKGRGAAHKTRGANANRASSKEALKKKEVAIQAA